MTRTIDHKPRRKPVVFTIFVTAPASAGCDWSATLDNTNDDDRLVNITLIRRTAEICSAELYEQVFEFATDVDLTDDFTVQVHVE
ncbi:hypothetical protein [Microbacterium sp.]|uniref:hypothetical protein n=1 Tax=Microbacterium sp. TaxID=51671 RepID=UPI003918C530